MRMKSDGVLLKILGWLGVALVVLVLVFWVLLDRSRRELRNYKAELEKRGEIFDLARLAPPKPPTENNGTAELIAVAEEIEAIRKKNEIKMWRIGQIETSPGRAEVGHRRGTVDQFKEERSWEDVTTEMEPIRPVLARLREAAKSPVLLTRQSNVVTFFMRLPHSGLTLPQSRKRHGREIC